MDFNIPLSTIILGELTLALSVLLAFVVRRLLRQKKIIEKLLERTKGAGAKAGDTFYDKNRAPTSQPGIADYFAYTLNDSQERFTKFTSSSLLSLDKEHPFSGKIAALRHLYLSAEQEVFAERGITHAGWGTLERRLAPIVQWTDQSASQLEKAISDLQRQLRGRDDEIKRHQAKNAHLLKRLENLRNEQHSLEHLNAKNSSLIEHLQGALEKLKSAPATSAEPNKASFSLPLNEHYIEKFGEAHSIENHNLRALLHEIKNTPSSLNNAQQKRIESQVNLLEIELLKSDRHVSDLKQQLKEAKLQITNYGLMRRDNAPTGDINSLYDNLMQKIAPENQDDPDTIIAEIKHLQESNKLQHNTVNKIENEISIIKDSINSEDSDTVNQEKEKEIQRLERLVKECQGCIVILEEEVDSLYSRLQEQASQLNQTPATETLPDTEAAQSTNFEEAEMLVQELQKTAMNYQHVYAINMILLDFLQCQDFDKLTQLLQDFIDRFNLTAGFYIDCSAGKTEYAPEHLVNTQERHQLINPDTQEPLVHLDNGILFNYTNIRALRNNTTQEPAVEMLDTNFQMVIAAANERLNDLTHYSHISEKEQDEPAINIQIKEMLNNLNIRYAFQIDENRKTFDHFISELRRAYGLLELKGPGAVVLDNAVNEFEMRMSLLLESGEAIDKEISLLVEKAEQV
ncbi:hypothetical protein [Cellvibrio sp. OA-2007]|uniref:hypothetical protein n=1 Tax=Cellvibrio sp. OA-2007 TaxID=529823 RepID=UPI0007855838|nr:hypothetical protein [Cellvibrio sp. OA-2007]